MKKTVPKRLVGRCKMGKLYGWPMNSWCVVTNIQNMSHLFDGHRTFNEDISDWNVSNIMDMSSTFVDATSLNVNLMVSWDVSSVTDMSIMFLWVLLHIMATC